MANILASLNVTAGALNAFDLALETTQNNVANAQTPGYVSNRKRWIRWRLTCRQAKSEASARGR